MRLSKMQQMVYDVIKENPGVQNNDAKLVAAVWRKYGWSDHAPLEENINRVARSETITRRRRELHEMGFITYSKEADETREHAYLKEKNNKAIPWLEG